MQRCGLITTKHMIHKKGKERKTGNQIDIYTDIYSVRIEELPHNNDKNNHPTFHVRFKISYQI